MNPKILVASGCSFTFEDWCWPTYVANAYNMELINRGMSGQGNSIIAKKAIYTVNELLNKGYKPEEILVGIMWSGPDRYDFYTEDTNQMKNVNGWIQNPTSISGIEGTEHWEILNAGWVTNRAKLWYSEFHTFIGTIIHTLEYMILTQLFLESKGVAYVMMNYMDFFNSMLHQHLHHIDVKFYNELLKKDMFIMEGEYDWVRDNCPSIGFGGDMIHPNEIGHEMFVMEKVIPFLKERYDFKQQNI
jgi:hypothetical protein